MSWRSWFTVGSILATLAGSTSVSAQDVLTPRAFQGVFGGAATRPGATHTLDVSASLAAMYEKNESLDQAPSLFEDSIPYESLSGSLSYQWKGERRTIGASAGANGRYFNEPQRFVNAGYYGGIGVYTDLGRRSSLTAKQSVGCGPLHLNGPTSSNGVPALGYVPVTGTSYALDQSRMCTSETDATIVYGLSRRSQIEGVSALRYSTFDEGARYDNTLGYSLGARFSQGLTRHASLRLGYVRRTGEFVAPGRRAPVIHDLTLGVDYDRGLSLTRRTYVDFHFGSTIVRTPEATAAPQRFEYHALGNAGLNHEFGRTWRVRLGYSREAGFVDGLEGIALTDTVVSSMTGFLTRRTDLAADFTVTTGSIQGAVADNPLRSRTASSRVRFALGRNWALYGEYFYYTYRYPASELAFDVPPVLHRHTAGAGLTWWLPIIRS